MWKVKIDGMDKIVDNETYDKLQSGYKLENDELVIDKDKMINILYGIKQRQAKLRVDIQATENLVDEIRNPILSHINAEITKLDDKFTDKFEKLSEVMTADEIISKII